MMSLECPELGGGYTEGVVECPKEIGCEVGHDGVMLLHLLEMPIIIIYYPNYHKLLTPHQTLKVSVCVGQRGDDGFVGLLGLGCEEKGDEVNDGNEDG